MNIKSLLCLLVDAPDSVQFNDVISVIDGEYSFTPVSFSNGGLLNRAGENSGSCRIFAFAQLHGLSEQQTLHCFGDFYRIDVLGHPQADNHQNIRHFIRSGWQGIHFDGAPLEPGNK